jgi:hypothetical protein
MASLFTRFRDHTQMEVTQNEEEEVGSYWMTLKKGEDNEI